MEWSVNVQISRDTAANITLRSQRHSSTLWCLTVWRRSSVCSHFQVCGAAAHTPPHCSCDITAVETEAQHNSVPRSLVTAASFCRDRKRSKLLRTLPNAFGMGFSFVSQFNMKSISVLEFLTNSSTKCSFTDISFLFNSNYRGSTGDIPWDF